MTTPNNQRPRRASHFAGEEGSRAARGDKRQASRGKHSGGAHTARRAEGARQGSASGAHRGQARVRTGNVVSPQGAMQTHGVSSRTARATHRAATGNVRRGNVRAKSRMPFLMVAAAAVIVVVAVAAIVVPSILGNAPQLIGQDQTVEVTIADGAGAQDIAKALYEEGLIENTTAFLNQAHKLGLDTSFKSGTYTFKGGMDDKSIIELLANGPGATGTQLTIPEGYTLKRVAAAVEETLGVPADDFLAQAKASNYVADYPFLEGAADDSLEGFLFPKTYGFQGNVDADTVIRAMLSQFQTETASLDLTYAESRGLTIAQVVNLASIVEKESTPSTRAAVAAVFWNRLENMGEPNYGYLQSDATTAYSVGHDPTAEEVHDTSDPYSTYANQGLPPTPICCPGLDALEAVCSPDPEYLDQGYYYFFFYNDADGNVKYVFSKTYEEHQQAIANAQG